MNIRSKLIIIVLSLLWIGCFVYIVKFAHVGRYADASNYYMMTSSIFYDGDLKYEKKDLDRALKRHFQDVPAGLYLTPTEDGYVYGKPFLYSLFSVPFYMFFKEKGFILLNFILFSLIVLMSYFYLKRKNDNLKAFLFAFFFFLFSASPIYIQWIHTEIFMMFLFTLLIFLWFRPKPRLFLASLLFGFLVASKPPLIIFFLGLMFWAALNNFPKKRIFVSLMLFLCSFFAVVGYSYFLTGDLICYAGTRHFFPSISDLPFYNGISDFSGQPQITPFMLQSSLRFDVRTLCIIGLTAFYYMCGRFTGILLYFTPVLGGLYLYGKTDKRKAILLGTSLSYMVFYIIIMCNNYFGGGHSIGNRWFLTIFPAFLFVVDKIRFNYIVKAIIVFSIIFNLSLIIRPNFNSEHPFAHTRLFCYRFFPIEKTVLKSLPFWGEISKFRKRFGFRDNFEGRETHIYANGTAKYKAYFLDGQLYQRGEGFYVANGDLCQIVLRADITGKEYIRFSIENRSPQTRSIAMNIAKEKRELFLLFGEEASIELPLCSLSSFLPISTGDTQKAIYQIDIKISGPDSEDLDINHFKKDQKEMVFFRWPEID